MSLTNLRDKFKRLSKYVFNYLKKDRTISYQTSEETITDIVIRKLKLWANNQSNSKFNVRSFTKRQESKNGADYEFDWYFVDSSGQHWIGFRIQAKILNLQSNKFEHLSHTYKNGLTQLHKLNTVSNNDHRIPFYCFYLHKDKESPLKGCSLSPTSNIQNLLVNTKKPTIDDILKISFPWHKLFNAVKDKDLSLPERVLLNLKEIKKSNTDNDNIQYSLLSSNEVEEIKYLLNHDSDDIPKNYYPESQPNKVIIIQDQEEYYD